MARPTTRSRSTKGQFKKRVPAPALKIARGKQVALSLPPETVGGTPLQITVTLGAALRFSLRTENKALREQRHAAACQQLESAFAAILAGPRKLTNEERWALAGLLYDDMNHRFQADPIDARWWEIVSEVTQDALAGPAWPPPAIGISAEDRRLEKLNRFVGPFLDATLLSVGVGVIVSDEDRPALLRAFAKRQIDVANKLKKNAEGDYSPDPIAAQIPEWESVPTKADPSPSAKAVTASKLFVEWCGHADQKAVKPSTLASYAPVFAKLGAFPMKRHGREPSAAELGREDFRAFIDMRSTVDGVSAKTINDTDLAGINAVFNWAVEHDLLTSNPATGVKRKVRKSAETGNKRRKTLNDAEALAILRHALHAASGSSQGNPKLTAAKRWVPWLMAYTGTRVGEMAQLRKGDVGVYDGHPAISITDEAGTVKTGATWHVPLHPHLIEQGFIDFADAAEDGHLFLTPRPDLYRANRKLSRTKDPRGILGPLQSVKNKLAEFTREVMPFDPCGPAPNHGWRHYFKGRGRGKIDAAVLNAFADHAAANVAESYGRDELFKAMVSALDKIPRYDV